jgi:hypothetical protein
MTILILLAASAMSANAPTGRASKTIRASPATQRLECGIKSRPRPPPPGSRRSCHTANGSLTFEGENREGHQSGVEKKPDG